MRKIALAIHGGAGTILRSLMTPELEREYRGGLEDALKIGWEILQKGGSAMDAVETAVCTLEDFPLFNAGRGSVFTHEGKNEMDASIMNGRTLEAGAVAFVKNVRNPIKLARLVISHTNHIFLAGAGANQFALQMGVEMADDAYFFTQHRYEQLLRAREEGVVELDHNGEEPELIEEDVVTSDDEMAVRADDLVAPAVASGSTQSVVQSKEKTGTTKSHENTRNASNRKSKIAKPKSLGTVGAVACDSNGDLAAGTSTGGMTNKKFGRIGDTPLIGAGTYADNQTCAVSCTGHGEFFMLGVTAYDVAARMKYKNIGLEQAARETIDFLTTIGGEGGLIAVDGSGNVTLLFNCEGMYRGYVSNAGNFTVDIYK